jgi:hypothetical protein
MGGLHFCEAMVKRRQRIQAAKTGILPYFRLEYRILCRDGPHLADCLPII